MTTPDPFMGDALTRRPVAKHTKFRSHGVTASTLDAVRVDVSSTKNLGSFTSTTLPGTEFERMRRYALVLTKWSHPNIDQTAKAWDIDPCFVEMANRIVANRQFAETFHDDPSIDTIYTKPYVSALTSGNVTPELVSATMSLVGTTAFDQIVEGLSIRDTEVANVLRDHAYQIVEVVNYQNDMANGLHRSSARARRLARDYYQRIARLGQDAQRDADKVREEREARKAKRKAGKATKPQPQTTIDGAEKVRSRDRVVIPLHDYKEVGWCVPYLAKHELVLPHTGLAGRRLIPNNEGKYPRAFWRMVTDPYRRIFRRKTRSLGGVVVFDCSGSMGLSDEQIGAVMRASAGCSILCYSASSSEARDAKLGNIHLVARHGRQARHLPEFPGGNGVDLAALKYGYYNLRLNSKSPVIWVSDGQVTGMGDLSTSELKQAVTKFIRRKGIRQVDTPEEAIQLLSKLQRRKPS